MGDKPSKRRKQSRVVTQPGEGLPRCPSCGITNSEKSALPFIDQLCRSNVELCAALRLVGRQILQLEKQDDHSLEKIRGALKRADNIRQALTNPDELAEALKNTYELVVDAPTQNSIDQAMNAAPVRKSTQRRGRFIRPNSLRVLRFPPD